MKNAIWSALVLVAVLVFASCSTKSETVEPTADEDTIFGASLACNCVKYARSRMPWLPTSLTTYTEKKNAITTKTAAVGSIAVMPGSSSKYGHVAYVSAVGNDGTITIDEANWVECKITTGVKVKPVDRKIVGYIK